MRSAVPKESVPIVNQANVAVYCSSAINYSVYSTNSLHKLSFHSDLLFLNPQN